MPRFDVYRNPIRTEARDIPFLLDVQSEFLAPLQTRMIVPLRRADRYRKTIDHLNPTIPFEGQTLVLDTASMAAVPRSALKHAVGNIRAVRIEIDNALDFLFTGI